MAAHAYWRINIHDVENTGSKITTQITELEFRVTKGVSNNPVASGIPLESGHYSSNISDLAFDANTGTWWTSNIADVTVTPAYIGMQYPSAIDPVEV